MSIPLINALATGDYYGTLLLTPLPFPPRVLLFVRPPVYTTPLDGYTDDSDWRRTPRIIASTLNTFLRVRVNSRKFLLLVLTFFFSVRLNLL